MIKIINQYIAWLGVMLGIVGLPIGAGAQGTCNIVRNPEIMGAIPNTTATSPNIWYGMGWFDNAGGFNSGLTWAAHSPNFALPGANSASTATPAFAFSSFNNVGGCLNMAAYFGNCPEGTTPTTPEGTIIRVVDTSNATAMRIPIFGCTIEESVLVDINGFTNTNATNRYFFAVREQHYANSSTAQNIGLRAALFNPNALTNVNTARTTSPPINTSDIVTIAITNNIADIFTRTFVTPASGTPLNTGAWARVGNTFSLSAGFNAASLWLTPVKNNTALDPTNTEGSFFNIDNIELVADDFPALQTATANNCAPIAARDYCMLSGVRVRYTWTTANGSPLLTYTVTKQHATGLNIVNGVIGAPIPALVTTATGTVTLTRVIEDYDGLNPTDLNISGRTTTSLTVTATPVPPTVTQTSNCGSVTLTCTNPANGFYIWSGPQSQQSTSNTFTVSTSATYVVSASSGACSASTSIAVTIPANTFTCIVAPTPKDLIGTNPATQILMSTLIANGSISAILTSGVYAMSNQTKYFNCTLVIDVNIEVRNCQFIMYPDAKIIVPGYFLGAPNSTFKGTGCRMWQGIDVAGSFLGFNTTISDALVGITLRDKSNIDCQNYSFLNNDIGIQVPREPTGTNTFLMHNITQKGLSNNRFATTNATLLPPFCNRRGSIGIDLNDVGTFNVQTSAQGGYTNLSSTFNNLEYGITARNAKLNVDKATFSNMENTNNTGIWVREGSVLQVVNTGSTASVRSFNNCARGIRAEGSSITAADNTMTNVAQGIAALTNANFPLANAISITNNTINCTQMGVFVVNGTAGLTGMLVRGNTINYANPSIAPASAAIQIQGGALYASNPISPSNPINNSVISNTITLNQNALVGIKVLSANSISNGVSVPNVPTVPPGLSIEGNTVNCNHATNLYGIQISGTTKVRVASNTITTPNAGVILPNATAIQNNASASALICSNTTERTGTGIGISGTCNGTVLRANLMNRHNTGLLYGSSGITGGQILQGNKFVGPFTAWGANHAGNPLQSLFIVNNATNPEFLPTFPAAVLPNWFTTTNTANITNCAGSTTPFTANPLNRLVAQDSLEFVVYEEGSKWAAERDLYQKIQEDPALLQDPDFGNFATQKATEGVGIYTNLDKDSEAALVLNATAKQQLANYDTQAAGYEQALEGLSNQLADTTLTEAARTALANQYEAAANAFKVVRNSSAQLQAAIVAENATELDALLLRNGTAPDGKVFEANEKQVNDIAYATVSKGNNELGDYNKTLLQAIAAQCPYSGGNVVYKARALLADYDLTFYDDKAICIAQGVRWRVAKPKVRAAKTTVQKDLTAQIYPNPTKGDLNLVWSTPIHEAGSMTVYNIYGQVVEATVTPQNSASTTVRILQSGMYIVKVQLGDDTILTQKVIVLTN